jgi:hypothetical protein
LPGHSQQAIGISRTMRWVVMCFCVGVLSLVWLIPNHMGRGAQLIVTLWFSFIGSLGLLVLLNRVGR